MTDSKVCCPVVSRTVLFVIMSRDRTGCISLDTQSYTIMQPIHSYTTAHNAAVATTTISIFRLTSLLF